MDLPESLDKLDRRILFELDRNSRQPVTEIARAIHERRDRVEYRIQRFVQEGIIKNFVAQIDLSKLGFTMFKIYLRLENNRGRVAEILGYLKKHPQVYWIAQCDGSWDLIIVIFASTAQEFHDFHTKVLSEFNSVILNFNAHTLVDLKVYSRNYFIKGGKVTIQEWGKPDSLKIDKTDINILRILAHDCRTPTVAIGEQINVAPHIVRYRIERIEKMGLISGYRINPNLSKLNMLFIKAQIFLRNYELSSRELLVTYCIRNPNIISFIEQIGDCNIELELEVTDYQQYYQIIDDIRSQYAKLIRNFQTILVRSSDYFPLPEYIAERTG